MRCPSLAEFRQVRRLFPVAAALLFLVALAFPMWVISVDAVQYPETTLQLRLYAYPRIAGDYVEMANLNKYIGFYYPDPVYWQPNYEPHPYAVDVPEWSFGPLAFVGCAAAGLFVAVAPTVRKLKLGLAAQFAGTLAVFGVMLADIQYRLYQTGHHLDPDAPVMGVEGFTPPLWGTYEVANITSHSRFGAGAYLAVVAVGLLAVAYRYRDEAVTPTALVGRLRARLPGGDDGESADRDAPTPGHTGRGD
jgi:hypothetical protein